MVLVGIVYDSISNSVFESQFLAPLLKKAWKNNWNLCIISTERFDVSAKLSIFKEKYPEVTFHLIQRHRFMGIPTLWPLVRTIKKMLDTLPPHQIVARGPHAGWMSLRCKNSNTVSLTIQARGLCAEEYAFSAPASWLKRIVAHFHRRIEQATHSATNNGIIEAVSPALKEYLIATYGADKNSIVIAEQDIPPILSPEERKDYRIQFRKQFHIPVSATVWCYSGSYKSWQCADETIALFARMHALNPNAFLLILSHDTAAFEKACSILPKETYRIISVETKLVIPALCAGDVGVLLRNNHIINWVSRPTKALEYQAAGLEILHNNTVKFLIDKREAPVESSFSTKIHATEFQESI